MMTVAAAKVYAALYADSCLTRPFLISMLPIAKDAAVARARVSAIILPPESREYIIFLSGIFLNPCRQPNLITTGWG